MNLKYLIILPFICLLVSCKTPETPLVYRPYESLLAVIADLEFYLNYDIYRFPAPKDISDQNIFRASLVRLANFEKINPGEFKEETALSQARSWLILCEYDLSSDKYVECIKIKGKLESLARKEWEVLESFREILKKTDNFTTLEEYIKQKKIEIEKIRDFGEKHKGSRFETLSLIESENAQVEMIEFIKMNRLMLKNPIKIIEAEYQNLLSENKESVRYYEHLINFADFYASSADEYVRLHPPERGDFVIEIFREYILKAIGLYSEVEKTDGIPERSIGKAKLESLNQFSRTIEMKAK